MTFLIRFRRILLAGAALGCAAALYAQIEGSDRGIPVIDSVSNFEVSGIVVDVAGKSAEVARMRAFREAQRQGWKKLWVKMHGGAAPGLSDGALDSIVSGIVIEEELISEHRYIAKLGITFDRVRAAEVLGVGGASRRSAPLLLIPVMWEGGVPLSYETRTEWQKAWAKFRTDNSPMDYVRAIGNGADPLLLTAAQLERPGRKWWRALLDQYGAVDLLVAQVKITRDYPGGPVNGIFSAHYGPDKKLLESFSLRVLSPASMPKLMEEGVTRIDQIFARALSSGILKPDTSLILEQLITEEEVVVEEEEKTEAPIETKKKEEVKKEEAPVAPEPTTFSIQFDSEDPGQLMENEAAVRGIPGVKSAATTSVALGGVSVMRVVFDGDVDMLRASLASRGYRVSGGGTSLRINK